MYETIRTDCDGRGVAVLTLNRPEKHNALSSAMIGELTEAAGRLGRDPAVRVVVLTGAGESYCAGGDLGWMKEQMAADGPTRAREAKKLASSDLTLFPYRWKSVCRERCTIISLVADSVTAG